MELESLELRDHRYRAQKALNLLKDENQVEERNALEAEIAHYQEICLHEHAEEVDGEWRCKDCDLQKTTADSESEIEEETRAVTETETPAAEETTEAPETEAPAAEKAAEAPETNAKSDAEEPEPEPAFDPNSCQAIAIGLTAFWEAVLNGEFDETDFQYYLEPAAVLDGPLVCTRAPENEPENAGLLMTRAGWQAKKVCLDDEVNPGIYELSFPKEFGYIKTLSHYQPETRKSAKYPWSKKY